MNKKRLQELKKLKYLLEMNLNQNQFFRKLYEKSNKKKIKDENVFIFSVGENRNIFSEIPKDTLEYLSTRGIFDSKIFDPENKCITITNYCDIIETIKCLINIIEFDLIKAFNQSDRHEINVIQ
jgi:hypothetical protein